MLQENHQIPEVFFFCSKYGLINNHDNFRMSIMGYDNLKHFHGEKFTPNRIDIDTAKKLLFPPSQTLVILE